MTALRLVALATLLAFCCAATAEHERELFKTPASGTCLSPDGKLLAAATAEDGGYVMLVANKKTSPLGPAPSVALSPDGKWVATLSAEKCQIFDIAGGKLAHQFDIPQSNTLCHAVTNDGAAYAFATGKSVVVMDCAKGKPFSTIAIPNNSQPFSMALSPDNKLLAVGTDAKSKRVFVFDTRTLKPTLTLTAEGQVASVAFSPDGKFLTAGSSDAVGVWEVAGGKLLRTLRNETGRPVKGVAFALDGKVLVAGSADGQVTIWGAADGTVLDTIAQPKVVSGLSASSEAGVIAVTLENGLTKVYDISKCLPK